MVSDVANMHVEHSVILQRALFESKVYMIAQYVNYHLKLIKTRDLCCCALNQYVLMISHAFYFTSCRYGELIHPRQVRFVHCQVIEEELPVCNIAPLTWSPAPQISQFVFGILKQVSASVFLRATMNWFAAFDSTTNALSLAPMTGMFFGIFDIPLFGISLNH